MNFEYISQRGDTLSLINDKRFKLAAIDGQTTGSTDISSAVLGGVDGDTVNNVQAQPRPLVIDLKIEEDVELTKRRILQVIKLKQVGTIRWEQADRVVEISGIIEQIEMPRWTDDVHMQITFHCEQPFWEDLDYIVSEINEVISLHYFTDIPNEMLYFPDGGIVIGEVDITRTRKVHNAGDVSVGLEIEIVAVDTVTNPIIYNDTGAFFGCGYGTGNKKVVMNAGDVIRINTGKNTKNVTLNEQSLLGKIKPNSTWLQLAAGDNIFSVNSDEAAVTNMNFSLTYKRRYV